MTSLVAELVDRRLWEQQDDESWYITNFVEYQLTSDELERRRDVKAEAGRRGGIASGQSRRSRGEAPASSTSEASTSASASTPGEANAKPTPLHTSTTNQKHAGGDDGFERFWQLYPPRNGKKLDKSRAKAVWNRLSSGKREAAMRGVVHYAEACSSELTIAKDAFRWLGREAWEDWQEPAVDSKQDPRAEWGSLVRQVQR